MKAARGWLAVGIALALAFGATTTAQDNTGPKRKPGDGRLEFSRDNQSWQKVLDFLVDQSGLTLVAQKLPSGTFTLLSPRARTYSLAEVFDAVNDGLMARGFILVRRQESMVLLPADARVDPSLVPYVKLEELAARGRTELVRVVLSPRALAPKDMVSSAKRLLGPFGDVTAIGDRLVVADTAGNLRQLLRILGEVEETQSAEPVKGNIRTVTLEHGNAATLADELERLLKQMRGNPVRVVTPGVRVDGPAKKADAKAAKLPGTAPIVLTAVGNRLIIASDDAEALNLVNELVRIHTQPTLQGPEIILLRNAPALGVAKLLNETFNGRGDAGMKAERVRILADAASNSLIVQANALDMATIRRLLDKALDAPGHEVMARTRLIGPLRHAVAAEVVKVVRQIYTNESLVIAADAKTNTLVLRCPDNLFEDVAVLIKLLDTKQN